LKKTRFCSGTCWTAKRDNSGAYRPLLRNWSSGVVRSALADLSGFEHKQMPLTAPGSLSNQNYTDITAFILKKNGFPAGSMKLMSGSGLSRALRQGGD
jgi:hypothetical protein